MTENELWLALACGLIGMALGVLATLVLRGRKVQDLRIQVESLRSHIAAGERTDAERRDFFSRTREQLETAFGELSQKSLKNNGEWFLELARERLNSHGAEAAGYLKERETAIEGLVRPIRESLARSAEQYERIERDRHEAFGAIKTQIESLATGQSLLSRETRNLVTALRRPEVRGRWGEITLRRLVELAGMSAHADFTEQPLGFTDTGTIRPDMIVHMPDRRDIVIDVKTPLDAYLSSVEAIDDRERAEHLRRHASAVGARIRELASKRYWAQFEHSPDFVVLFLPGDHFMSAALGENPDLIDESLRQNVMLATPTSLVALLKAVAYGWKQTALQDNAAEIRRAGEELYKRLAVFGEHLAKLGRSLGSSVESFNKAVGSLENQVLPTARRFPDLGLRIDRNLEPLEPVVTQARVPSPTSADGALDPSPSAERTASNAAAVS